MNNLSDIDFLLKLTDFGIKLGLEKTFNLLEKFNNPHTKYKSILIAGSNGKGSVAKTLSTILTEAGYKVGLYTSPHLVDIKERIVVNGENIPEDILLEKIKVLRNLMKESPYEFYPTFFEAMTVIAFSYFADVGIDFLVCEVGLGGRFDATNVLPSLMEIITPIGLEHIHLLGKTYSEIANEKAGIIKEDSVVVTAAQHKEALSVIKDKAKAKNSKLYLYRKDFTTRKRGVSINGQQFDFYSSKKYINISTSLLGEHQIGNMALVLESLILLQEKGIKIYDEAVYTGMSKVKWPCRFQLIRENPIMLMDGAHNYDGVKILLKTLKEVFPKTKFSFVVSILKSKDWKKMLQSIQRFQDIEEIVFTKSTTERAVDPQLLASYIKRKNLKIKVIPDYEQAYLYVTKRPKNVCICGSLYLCGNILPLTTTPVRKSLS